MAYQILGLVADRQLGSPTRKAIMMSLANHADGETGSTIVGQERIASECDLSRRTVMRHLAAFEAEGLITRVRRARRSGRGRTSDETTIVVAELEKLPTVPSTSRQDLSDSQSPWSADQGDTVSPATPDLSDTDDDQCDNGDTTNVTQSHRDLSVEPASRTKRAPAHGRRLPEGWHPDPEPDLVDAIGGQAAARREFDKFVDYWRGTPGAKGRKVDWQATWRNWLRRTAESLPEESGPLRPRGDVETPEQARQRFAELTGIEVA